MLGLWTNEFETVVAESENDAKDLLVKLGLYELDTEEIEGDGWRLMSDNEDYTLIVEIDEAPYTQRMTKKAKDWCVYNGRGHLGSSEY